MPSKSKFKLSITKILDPPMKFNAKMSDTVGDFTCKVNLELDGLNN